MARYVRNPTTGLWELVSGKPGVMVGATAESDGSEGECSAPSAGDQNKIWTGGAKWENDTSKLITNFTSADNASETGIIVDSGETAMSDMTSGTNHSGLFGLISKSVLNIRKLINTVKRIWSTVANTWVEGTAYTVGDVRLWTNGHTYICKLAHTSSSSITPANTTYWDDKTIGDIIKDMQTSFQDGVDAVYNACVTNGVTPSASTPTAIAQAISQVRTPIKGAWTGSGTPSGNNSVNVTVPAGFHNGSGYVTCNGGTAYTAGRNQGHADAGTGICIQIRAQNCQGGTITYGWRYGSDDWHTIRGSSSVSIAGSDVYSAKAYSHRYNNPPLY